jgi:hypothetical protein
MAPCAPRRSGFPFVVLHIGQEGSLQNLLRRLVDQSVGPGGRLGDGVDGVLEDLALAACHEVRLNRCYDSNRETRA